MDDKDYDTLEATDPIGFVRALIPDIERLSNPIDPTEEDAYLFSDVTLGRYLALNNGSAKRAAADACEALGSSEMLILKKLTTEDLATDGSVLAREYGAKANRLRAQATKDEDDDSGDGGGFFMVGQPRHPIPFDAERAMRYRTY